MITVRLLNLLFLLHVWESDLLCDAGDFLMIMKQTDLRSEICSGCSQAGEQLRYRSIFNPQICTAFVHSLCIKTLSATMDLVGSLTQPPPLSPPPPPLAVGCCQTTVTVTGQKAQSSPNHTKCSLPARHQHMVSYCTSQNDLPFIEHQPQITRKFLQLTQAHVVNPVQTAQKYKKLAAIDQM